MPEAPSDQIQMYSTMLERVQEALKRIAPEYDRIDSEIEQKIAFGEDAKELAASRKNLRMQELCLRDQETRLQERISSLLIGSSISA